MTTTGDVVLFDCARASADERAPWSANAAPGSHAQLRLEHPAQLHHTPRPSNGR